MTRVKRVEKSRVERRCHQGHPIPAGSAYTHATPGFRGRTIYACPEHPFRQSDLTANDLLSDYYRAVEELEDSVKSWDGVSISDLTDAIDNAKSSVEEVISQWDERLDSMGDLAQGDTGQTIQERRDSAEEWCSELDSANDELESLEPDPEPNPESEEEPETETREEKARDIMENVIGASSL